MKKIAVVCLIVFVLAPAMLIGGVAGSVLSGSSTPECNVSLTATVQVKPVNQKIAEQQPDNPELFNTIKEVINGNARLGLSMLMGSHLESDWNNNATDGMARGPWQIQWPGVIGGPNPGITPEQAEDPVYSTHYMFPRYRDALKHEESLASKVGWWRSHPEKAGELVAYYAERPATIYHASRGWGVVDDAYQASLSVMKDYDFPGNFDEASTTCNELPSSACQVPAPGSDPQAVPPPEKYKKVYYQGQTLDKRTLIMIRTAEHYAKSMGVPVPFVITQGSFSSSVSASAGTHSGGGAADISIAGFSQAQIDATVKALRMAGGAAWERTPAEGFIYHVHVIFLGDRLASQPAVDQEIDYFEGKDALADNAPDTDAQVGRPYPNWSGAVCQALGVKSTITTTTWTYPIHKGDYTLGAGFGQVGSHWESFHTGQDFVAPTGTPVVAAQTGTIVSAKMSGPYGNKIVIRGADKTETWYCHLSAYVLRSGHVTAGTLIGKVGSTGNTTGPHLHLEVHPHGGPAVDPLTFLRSKGLDP